jgi:hypothetical protein
MTGNSRAAGMGLTKPGVAAGCGASDGPAGVQPGPTERDGRRECRLRDRQEREGDPIADLVGSLYGSSGPRADRPALH